MTDTAPSARAMQEEALRRMSPEARLRLAFEMSDLARALFRAGLEARRGPVTDQEAAEEFARAALAAKGQAWGGA